MVSMLGISSSLVTVVGLCRMMTDGALALRGSQSAVHPLRQGGDIARFTTCCSLNK